MVRGWLSGLSGLLLVVVLFPLLAASSLRPLFCRGTGAISRLEKRGCAENTWQGLRLRGGMPKRMAPDYDADKLASYSDDAKRGFQYDPLCSEAPDPEALRSSQEEEARAEEEPRHIFRARRSLGPGGGAGGGMGAGATASFPVPHYKYDEVQNKDAQKAGEGKAVGDEGNEEGWRGFTRGGQARDKKQALHVSQGWPGQERQDMLSEPARMHRGVDGGGFSNAGGFGALKFGVAEQAAAGVGFAPGGTDCQSGSGPFARPVDPSPLLDAEGLTKSVSSVMAARAAALGVGMSKNGNIDLEQLREKHEEVVKDYDAWAKEFLERARETKAALDRQKAMLASVPTPPKEVMYALEKLCPGTSFAQLGQVEDEPSQQTWASALENSQRFDEENERELRQIEMEREQEKATEKEQQPAATAHLPLAQEARKHLQTEGVQHAWGTASDAGTGPRVMCRYWDGSPGSCQHGARCFYAHTGGGRPQDAKSDIHVPVHEQNSLPTETKRSPSRGGPPTHTRGQSPQQFSQQATSPFTEQRAPPPTSWAPSSASDNTVMPPFGAASSSKPRPAHTMTQPPSASPDFDAASASQTQTQGTQTSQATFRSTTQASTQTKSSPPKAPKPFHFKFPPVKSPSGTLDSPPPRQSRGRSPRSEPKGSASGVAAQQAEKRNFAGADSDVAKTSWGSAVREPMSEAVPGQAQQQAFSSAGAADLDTTNRSIFDSTSGFAAPAFGGSDSARQLGASFPFSSDAGKPTFGFAPNGNVTGVTALSRAATEAPSFAPFGFQAPAAFGRGAVQAPAFSGGGAAFGAGGTNPFEKGARSPFGAENSSLFGASGGGAGTAASPFLQAEAGKPFANPFGTSEQPSIGAAPRSNLEEGVTGTGPFRFDFEAGKKQDDSKLGWSEAGMQRPSVTFSSLADKYIPGVQGAGSFWGQGSNTSIFSAQSRPMGMWAPEPANAGWGGVKGDDGDGEGVVAGDVAIEKGEGIVQLDEVKVVTGEEDEQVLESLPKAKLFEYVKNGSDVAASTWESRGIGSLKVNKSNEGKVRVLMRRDGNLEVMLNSALVKGMACSKGGEKGVTFTGQKGNSLVTYLIKCGTRPDADRLLEVIEQNRPE